MNILYFATLFFAKVIDNTFATAKTILVQKNKSILAGIALGLSNYIYLRITKDVVTTDSELALIVVAIASGVGCCLAVTFNNKFSKDKVYVNVIMSDDKVQMQDFRDFLAENHITNTTTDSYTREWDKTIAITAYAETKDQSRLIDNYIESSGKKFKRVVSRR